MTTADIIDAILKREGGYTDHPVDRGGPTNWGVTLDTLEHYRGSMVTAQDVRDMTETEARAIYEKLYVIEPGFVLIPDDRLRVLIVDIGVNMGTGTATKMLQKSLEVPVDGILGPKTLAALDDTNVQRVYLGVCAERVRKYGRIISADHSQAVFAAGWMNRVAEFIEGA